MSRSVLPKLNFLIKIYVSLICYDNEVSIQNYLKIVNENKIYSSSNITKNGSLYELCDKIISYFMDPNILIVSLKTFFVLLYTKNIYQNRFDIFIGKKNPKGIFDIFFARTAPHIEEIRR